MMKNKIQLLLLLSICFYSVQLSAQTYYYSRTTYTYGPYYFNQTMGFINRIYEDKQKKEREAQEKELMKQRVQQMRTYYSSLETYPKRVMDGWHDVSILSGDEFIDTRKVYVKNNKITKLYWDDWLEQEVASAGPIIKAKSGVQLKNGSGAELSMLEAYFINYIGDSTVNAEPPKKPGRLTFFTTNSKYDKLYVQFEDAVFGPFKQGHAYNDIPLCGSENEINIVYKPGVHDVKIVTQSSSSSLMGNSSRKVLFEGKIRIKENGCELVHVADTKMNLLGEKLINPEEYKKGKIGIWTNDKNYKKLFVEFEGDIIGPFKGKHKTKNPPIVIDDKMITLNYKPGTYKYKLLEMGKYSYIINDYRYQTLYEETITITDKSNDLFPILKK